MIYVALSRLAPVVSDICGVMLLPGAGMPKAAPMLLRPSRRQVRLRGRITKSDDARQPQRALPAILVVEDDRCLRATAIELFTGLGLAVFAAGDGYDTPAPLAKRPRVGVLFSDIRLPGIDGVELAKAARELRPDLQIVLTSAYVDCRGGARNDRHCRAVADDRLSQRSRIGTPSLSVRSLSTIASA